MAAFCLATKISPEEYRQLSWIEYIAFANLLQPSEASDGYPQF